MKLVSFGIFHCYTTCNHTICQERLVHNEKNLPNKTTNPPIGAHSYTMGSSGQTIAYFLSILWDGLIYFGFSSSKLSNWCLIIGNGTKTIFLSFVSTGWMCYFFLSSWPYLHLVLVFLTHINLISMIRVVLCFPQLISFNSRGRNCSSSPCCTLCFSYCFWFFPFFFVWSCFSLSVVHSWSLLFILPYRGSSRPFAFLHIFILFIY